MSDYEWLLEYMQDNGAQVCLWTNLDGAQIIDVCYQGSVLASFSFKRNGDYERSA